MKNIKKGILIMIIAGLAAFGVVGCADGGQAENGNSTENDIQTDSVANTFEMITQEQAKSIMDSETGYIILDVRTDSEFAEGHIKNAILIPDYEIAKRAESELTDKNQLILVYCRSGRRSKLAAQALADLGYTDVKEFGGIIDWKYETVK